MSSNFVKFELDFEGCNPSPMPELFCICSGDEFKNLRLR